MGGWLRRVHRRDGTPVTHLADNILQLRGVAALAVVFALPALESSVFLGVVFPGEIAVLLGGVLAFEHKVPLPAVLVVAVAGAVVGDSVGYAVGRRWGRRMLGSTVGRLVRAEHLERAETYLRERGGKAVFFGRFTAALRALVPGLAGMSGMPYRTFVLYNVVGGGIWAVGFALLGYAAGSSWRRVESVAKRASLVLLAIVVTVVVVVFVTRWIIRHRQRLVAGVGVVLDLGPIAAARTRFRRQLDFLAGRLSPEGALGLTLTTSLVLVAAAGWALGAVISYVVAGDAARVDDAVLAFFVRHREPWLTTIMKGITSLGSSAVLIGVVAALGALWWVKRRSWRPLLMLTGAYAGADVLFRVVKALTGRDRPPASQAIGHFTGLAFPSGHATQAVAVWGMVAALVAVGSVRWSTKVTGWAVAVVVAGLVGVSRLYLGAHWLTDVLGGWALGAVWLAVLLVTVRTVGTLRDRRARAVS